jgi:hypothetical protein
METQTHCHTKLLMLNESLLFAITVVYSEWFHLCLVSNCHRSCRIVIK